MNFLLCIFILILKYSLLLIWGVGTTEIFAHPSKLQCVVAKSVVDTHNADDMAAKRRKQFANFLSGGLAGTISSTLTAPLEVLIHIYIYLLSNKFDLLFTDHSTLGCQNAVTIEHDKESIRISHPNSCFRIKKHFKY